MDVTLDDLARLVGGKVSGDGKTVILPIDHGVAIPVPGLENPFQLIEEVNPFVDGYVLNLLHPDANIDTNGYHYRDCDSYGDCNSYSNSLGYAYCHSQRNRNAYGFANTDGNANRDGYCNSDAYSNCHAYSDSDT